MNIRIPATNVASITWTPGQSASSDCQLVKQGESLLQRAEDVTEYLKKRDGNDIYDACPADGQVCVPIDDTGTLLEANADRFKLAGAYSEERIQFTAVAWKNGQEYQGESKMMVRDNLIFQDRPAYLNSSSDSILESLTRNPDGTLTYTRGSSPEYDF